MVHSQHVDTSAQHKMHECLRCREHQRPRLLLLEVEDYRPSLVSTSLLVAPLLLVYFVAPLLAACAIVAVLFFSIN